MRRMVWSFVVGGLVAVNAQPATSQSRVPADGTASSTSAAPAAPSAFRRSSPPQGASSGRNYYKELFGTQTSTAPATTAAPAAPSEEEAPAAPANAAAPAAPVQRAGSFTISSGRKSPASTATAPRGVIRAEYERKPGPEAQQEIEQVAAQRPAERRVIRRPPVTRLAEPISTAPTTDVAPASLERPIHVEDIPAPPRPPVDVAETPAPPAPTAAPAAASSPAATGAQSPALTLEWTKGSEISVGKEFTCQLVVRNTGATAARDVEIAAYFPEHVRLIEAEPRPAHTEGLLGWTIPEMAAGASQTIEITMIPLRAGQIVPHADVRFTSAVATKFAVSEPLLAVELEGPLQVMIGESASQTIVVSNPGTGVATHVQVEALIPAGLEHARGSRLLMDLGALHPGETRNVRLPMAAVTGGKHIVQVQARAETDLMQEASAEIEVISPQLTASIEGPGLRYLGRQATYTLKVTNSGSVATDNVRVMHKVPEGFTFVSAAQGAQYDEAARLVNWFVGRLEQGQSASAEVTFTCGASGEHTHFVRATSEHGTISDADTRTQVEGTPTLAMTIHDIEDPVEVASETEYEIRVTNDGSAPAANVNVSCELPAGMSLLSAEAPVTFAAERDLVVFQPLAQLKPGETVTIRLHVKASAAGNLRLRARLSSESIEEPLLAEELTKFYGE